MQRHTVEQTIEIPARQIVEEPAERTDSPSSAHESTIAQTVDCPALGTQKKKKKFDVNRVFPQELFSDRFVNRPLTPLCLFISHEHAQQRIASSISSGSEEHVEHFKVTPPRMVFLGNL